MACLTTEKSSPLPQPTQKRCSLPGPMGSLNLYATHQQRRLSERGLMIYRPNKPDIDLIRDFTNPSKKTSSSFLSCNSNHGYYQQQRRHSTVINAMPSPSAGHPSSSTSSGPWPGSGYTTERRHSSIIPGSMSAFNQQQQQSGGGGAGSSKNVRNFNMTSIPSIVMASASSNNNNGPGPSHQQQHHHHASIKGGNSGPSSTCNSNPPTTSGSAATSSVSSSGTGCRKVRLRIHKNPGAKEKFVVLGPTSASCSSPDSDDDKINFLRHPQFDNRRFSDSATTVRPPSICITPDAAFGPSQRGICRRSRLMTKDSGIVCSTGDLLTLKCLTSSAYEIRSPSMTQADEDDDGPSTSSSLQSLGSRSRSFDATIVLARKGPGSSWFSRRHQPIAVKLPLPINSPTISSPGDTRYFPCSSAAGIIRTPLLTITNENASKSELIEIPSPPAASPSSSRNSPEEKTKVAWDKNGFVLDAAVLGIAIENHLRKVDMKRRATFSALYQPQPIFLESKVSTRARSASACVPFPIPMSVTGSCTEAENGGSIFGGGGRSTSCRKSSLTSTMTSMSGSSAGGRLFSWDRGGSASSGNGNSRPGTCSSSSHVIPSSSISSPPHNPIVMPTATTSISFTSSGSSSGQSTYETHLHRLPMSMGMSQNVYMNNLDSPSSDSFVNFRATEDDIEEENGGEEGDEDENCMGDHHQFIRSDGIPEEEQAFLTNSTRPDLPPKKGSMFGGRWAYATNFTSQTVPGSSGSSSRPNEGNQAGGGGTNNSRHTGMSICSAIRDFILQSIRS